VTDETRQSPTKTVSYTAAVIGEIAAERARQVSKEGWSIEHDDEHDDGSMADAAACYAATTNAFKAVDYEGVGRETFTAYRPLWPKSWAEHWWRPKKSRRRRLIVAAALLVAEIERLDRAEPLTSSHRPEGS
jgi:hypothetical protein